MRMTKDQMQQMIDSACDDRELVMLAQQIPLEHFITTLRILGGPRGFAVYIPTPENFFQALYLESRNAEICNRYDGKNTGQLSIEYKVSERRIQQIVASGKSPKEAS